MKRTLVQSALALAVTSIMATAHADQQTAVIGQGGVTKLETIVVTATGYEQEVAKAPASISVITAEEIEKKSYNDVSDALKNVPGVYIQGGGSNKTINIRGMGSDYTLLLIDGKPMQGKEADDIRGGNPGNSINFLPPMEAIERIEVIRGPASALYGSDAMGGVVNIITKKHSDKVEASVRTEYIKADNDLNGDSTNTNVYVNAPLIDKTLSFQLNAGYLKQDEGNFKQLAKMVNGDEGYERESIGGKLIYTPNDDNTIRAGYSHTLLEREATSGKSVPLTTAATYKKVEKSNFNIDHSLKKDNFVIDSYINYDKDKNTTQSGGTGLIEFDTLTLNTQGTYFFSNNSLSVGANYKQENLEDGASNSLATGGTPNFVKLDRYQWSLFAEDTWNPIDDLALTFSGRFDNNEQFGSNFSPKAYAVYSATDDLTIKGGVISGYKAPSLRYTSPDYAMASMGGGMLPNKDLGPEKSLTYEGGLAYNNADLGLSTSLMIYSTKFEDKIQRLPRVCEANVACTWQGNTYPSHANGWTTMVNLDEAVIQGLEFTTDYDITEKLKYRQSYTYTDSEIKKSSVPRLEGLALFQTSKHMFNAGLDWDVNEKLMLWTQVNYRSSILDSFNSQQINSATDSLYTRIGGFTFADVGAVYKYDDKLQFMGGIYNITDREVTGESDSGTLLDGRRFSLAMNIKF